MTKKKNGSSAGSLLAGGLQGDVGSTKDFEHQMAVQMGWSKPAGGEGTPVPLEQSKLAAFPASKGAERSALKQLFESPHNPRKVFKSIDELAKSIAATGCLFQ